ncbi:MAG TPA: hypothetical protein VFX50_01100, partial [Gemmatimonadales bacterium]|nr:hypothetical protein [Gemmatimonadales bacterium]
MALQVVALASLLATFSVPYALTQHLSRTGDADRRRRLMQASAAVVALLSVVTAAVLMAAAPLLARGLYSDAALTPVLVACGPLTLVAAAYQWVEGAMQGLRRFGRLARGGAWIAGADLLAGVLAASWGVVAMLVSRTVV